jgi:hypothetical protein
VTVALYEMACGLCDDPIVEGDRIVKVDDEWCHEECAEQAGERVGD